MRMLVALLAVSTLCVASVRSEESGETKTVKARSLELQVPQDWVVEKPTSSMRAAQLSIPGKPSDAELTVFYFGGGATGGTKANVERWLGQFAEDDRQVEMYQGKCEAGRYILVDCQGTWNKPDGPPFARKTVETPNSRVLNVILVKEKDGGEEFYFIKLSGHEDVVGEQTGALREAIGVKEGSEKSFELEG